MNYSNIVYIFCMLFASFHALYACPDCSLTAHTIGQPFFAHVIPEQTYQGTPLERNQIREEEFKEECTQCGRNHE